MNFSECSRLCLNILNLNFITNLDYSTVIYILWMNNGGLSNLSMVLEWVSGGSRIQNCIALGSRAHTFIHNTTSSIQSLSHVWFFVIQWTAARQASLSITNSQSLLKLTSMESVMPSNRLILCHPLLFLPSVFPSIRVFSNESALRIRWPKYWSFSFSIIPSKEHPGLISFRMDWLDHLAVQGTLKSFLQHHSSKASVLQCSTFFTVQLSHPYMTIGKTIALTRWPLLAK